MHKVLATIIDEGRKYTLVPDTYYHDGTKAISAYEGKQLYASITINLSEYKIKLEDDEVILNHDILGLGKFADRVIAALSYPGTQIPITYGRAYSFKIQLRPEFLHFWDKE